MAQKEFSETKLANILKQTAEWVAAFETSEQRQALTQENVVLEETITTFTKAAYEKQLRAPKEWTGASVAELFEETNFDAATIAAYIAFLGEVGHIKNAATLLKKVPATTTNETKAKAEKAPAKKTAQVKTKQKTTYSEEEVERFNLFPMGNFSYKSPVQEAKKATKVASEKPATATDKFAHVGRNEACPCGSGKKFKKCHGRAS